MQVVCEATQNPTVAVQVGAFECLVRIMGLYYDKMALYMEQALFGVRILPGWPLDAPLCLSLCVPADCYGNETLG
jgi:importin subunit beta-1